MSDWYEKVVEEKKGRQGDGCDAFIPFRRGIGMDACGGITNAFRLCFFLCLRRCKRRWSSSWSLWLLFCLFDGLTELKGIFSLVYTFLYLTLWLAGFSTEDISVRYLTEAWTLRPPPSPSQKATEIKK